MPQAEPPPERLVPAASSSNDVVRTATNLVSSTVITAGLGVVFWAVAARMFTTEEVGEANAALSAATLLALIAQLSLGSVCSRYVPRAGRYTGWIIRRIYLVVSACAVLAGLLAVVIVSDIDNDEGLVAKTVFVVGTLTLTLFAIQDQALLGLGRSSIIPIENTLFAVAKIALLPVLASVSFVSGIFMAWIIPAAASAVIISVYVFGRVVPARERAEESIPLPPRRELWPLLFSQYAASITSQLAILGVPILVTLTLGPEQNGYLAIAWLVGASFAALLSNISQSFCYHVRSGDAITTAALRRLGAMMFVVGVLGGLVVVIAAPLILAIIAPGYQDAATPALRLIGLAVPFFTLRSFWSTFMWLENRLLSIAGAYLIIALGTLGLTYALGPTMGIAGAGLGLLVSNAVVGVAALPAIISRVKRVKAGEGSRWIRWEAA
ncbi:MAG: hypothetical protein U0904_12425 [Candidatus Nanopelagicales bacterium]|nr:hypothetical protein [Candidatus Nanopelagicales bacterium]